MLHDNVTYSPAQNATTAPPQEPRVLLGHVAFVCLVAATLAPYYVAAILCARATGERELPLVPLRVSHTMRAGWDKIAVAAAALVAFFFGSRPRRSYSQLSFDDEIDNSPTAAATSLQS